MISILLAVYNGEKYLKKSILSVLNQTFTDFELLIGFNGTIDNSKSIVSEFDDKRIKVFDYGMDSGKSRTLNKMLKEANGEWLAIQDDDDIWLSNKLEIQMKLALLNIYDVIGTAILYCNEKEELIGSPNVALKNNDICLLSLNGYNQVFNTSAIFKKSQALAVGGWDENIVGEDYDFWLKLIKKGCVFANSRKKLVLHRLHQDSNFNTKGHNIQSIIVKYNLTKSPSLYEHARQLKTRVSIFIYLLSSKLNNVFWFYKLKFGNIKQRNDKKSSS